LIFFSATLEKKRAFTMTGCLGRLPLPRTLKYPARVMSMTGAFFSLSAYLVLGSILGNSSADNLYQNGRMKV
jgi:hypothetical protein